jgi:hypothetical protein
MMEKAQNLVLIFMNMGYWSEKLIFEKVALTSPHKTSLS